jgi:hypothetical protein
LTCIADCHVSDHVVAPRHRRGRIDGVHHVVQRLGQRVNVLAIDRRHKRPVEPLDDGVRQAVALRLNLLDLQRDVPGRRVGGQHPLEQRGARHDPVGQGDEVGKELFFAGNQAEAHVQKYVISTLHRRDILFTPPYSSTT